MSDPPTGGRVLIVAADPDLRDYVRACLPVHLARLGEVLEAGDGPRALEVARRGCSGAGGPDEPIHLAISDLALPGLDGLALARACARLRPPVPVLLLSADLGDREARAAGAAGVLAKPFNRRRLRRWVEALLGAGAPGDGAG